MVPDRWRCRKPPPSLFTHAVYPQMPMERAISAQGLLRASNSSKVNSTGAFSARLLGLFHTTVTQSASRRRSSGRTIPHEEGANFAPRINRPGKDDQSTA
jgi:hypothetical protein